MPCDTILQKPEIEKALELLESALVDGQAKLIIDRASGGIAFSGFDTYRNGITDVCAFRMLQERGSCELTKAIIIAEAEARRSISHEAVALGVHSHDQGKTWHGGH